MDYLLDTLQSPLDLPAHHLRYTVVQGLNPASSSDGKSHDLSLGEYQEHDYDEHGTTNDDYDRDLGHPELTVVVLSHLSGFDELLLMINRSAVHFDSSNVGKQIDVKDFGGKAAVIVIFPKCLQIADLVLVKHR